MESQMKIKIFLQPSLFYVFYLFLFLPKTFFTSVAIIQTL